MEAAIERPGWLSTDAWPWPVRAVATPTGRIAFTDFGRWSDFRALAGALARAVPDGCPADDPQGCAEPLPDGRRP